MEDDLKSGLQEEQRIMDERASDRPYFSADTFQQPIRNVCRHAVETVDVSATMGDCVKVMQTKKFGAVVITEGGKIAGIVTERDVLLKGLAAHGDWLARPVTEFMTRNPDVLQLDDPLVFIMNRMHVGGYRHVPIVDEDGTPTHIVSIRDVLRFILEHFEQEVSNIPPEPYRGPPKQWGG